ncbi:MAG: acetyl-CoA carboxylase biotin carboxyl carrier protein [Sulfurospirillum sp.]|nr:acetyl-CoA carboxylase biotin carboxyl carrier protein [Sulfurospirillum sp.]
MNKIEIRELMRFFDKSGITKLKIKDGDFSIEMQKGFESVSFAPATVQATPQVSQTLAQETQAPVKKDVPTINSPMVGTYYKAPAPGAESFVKVGNTVKKGQAIGIIEAMKIMNEIEAEFDCKILEVLIEDGQPVEYDMPLFAVEKL